MTQFSHLQIYKTATDFLRETTVLISHFSRQSRYSLGEKIQNLQVDFIILIYKANSSKSKEIRSKYIEEMIENIQYLNVLLRLSCEVKEISQDKFIDLVEVTQDIQRQLAGWLTYTNKQVNKIKETGINDEQPKLCPVNA